MKYDFTSIIDRRGRDALAVDALGITPGCKPHLAYLSVFSKFF